jgi:hypothetical protein
MVRSVVRFSQAMHEDFAIVTISPLPAQLLVFGTLQEVIHEFLDDHLRVHVREIQPSHLGQGLVRFANAHDRDLLVNNNPHPYGDILLDFVCHDQGRNWRALNFNRECWLMLPSFPLDYWTTESIQNAIDTCGKVMLLENDRGHLAWLMVKVRVTNLKDVSHFIVFSESEGFQGQFWTVQCEVLEQRILGGSPC